MKFKIFFFMSLALFFGSRLTGQVANKAYNIMLQTLLSHSVPELLIDDLDENDTNIIFLDAREKDEYNVSHIKGAQFVGYDNFSLKSVKGIAKDSKIVIYCSVGYRSEKIAEKLIKDGYSNVSNLYGGIFEWKNRGNDVYKNEAITEKVHAYNRAWGIWLTKGKKVY